MADTIIPRTSSPRTTIPSRPTTPPNFSVGDTVIYHPSPNSRNRLTTIGTIREVQTHPAYGVNASPSNPHYHITNNKTGRPVQIGHRDGGLLGRLDLGAAEEGRKRREEEERVAAREREVELVGKRRERKIREGMSRAFSGNLVGKEDEGEGGWVEGHMA